MVARWRPRDVEFDTTAVAGTAAVGAAVSRFTFYLIFLGEIVIAAAGSEQEPTGGDVTGGTQQATKS